MKPQNGKNQVYRVKIIEVHERLMAELIDENGQTYYVYPPDYDSEGKPMSVGCAYEAHYDHASNKFIYKPVTNKRRRKVIPFSRKSRDQHL